MFRELAVLLNANVNLITALEILISTAEFKDKKILNHIKTDINSGLSFSKACMKYPKLYPAMITQLLEAGERSAALPTVLNHVADYLDKISVFKSKLYKALFYPVIVLITAVLISGGLLYFVVPQFESLFADMGAELPWLTRGVIHLAGFIKTDGKFLLGIIIFIIFGYYGLQKYSNFKIPLPVINQFKNKMRVIQLCRSLSLLLGAGVSLVDGLYLNAEWDVRDKILRGEKLSNALHSTARFSPLVIQLINVGEASGSLSPMLLRIAVITETEIDARLSKCVQLLEPCLMIFMGLFIGGLVIAMYLPVFQLGRVV